MSENKKAVNSKEEARTFTKDRALYVIEKAYKANRIHDREVVEPLLKKNKERNKECRIN